MLIAVCFPTSYKRPGGHEKPVISIVFRPSNPAGKIFYVKSPPLEREEVKNIFPTLSNDFVLTPEEEEEEEASFVTLRHPALFCHVFLLSNP